MKEKIAILTDSGSDVLKEESKDLFILPLLIQIEDKTYIDGIDINLDEILNLLDNHKITTSLPSPEDILKTLDEIKSLGYTHVIVSTISSGLSGTYNIVRMIIEDYEGLEIALIDTKNISKASGYTTYRALELINEGKKFEEIIPLLYSSLDNHKVFFTVGTVEYLRRGGRIGLVAGAIAGVLHIKPVITCNVDGVYHSVKKTRGYHKAISKMVELAKDFTKNCLAYDLTILVAKIDEKTNILINNIKEAFSNASRFEIKKITPALAIHTGPEAFGLALRRY